MVKGVAVVGDATTTGGLVISGSGRGFCGQQAIALRGDIATCPKCEKGSGKIIEGANSLIIDGIPAAYDGCIVACGCDPVGRNKIIATKSYMFVDASNSSGSASSATKSVITSAQAFSANGNTNTNTNDFPSFASSSRVNSQQNPVSNNDKRNIRLDAASLLDCADEVCEKHLYHDDIQQAFKQEVNAFVQNIVNQVDNGTVSYEEGSQQIKEEKNSLLDQGLEWTSRGLSVLGGTGLMMAGAAMCTTGVGCIIGVYFGAHGVNSIQEGIFGGDGYLKSSYQGAAKQLGMSESVGSFVYDFIDLGISVRGKLKLVPKLNEFGNPVFRLWRYGRQDLIRAYKQMGEWALTAEIMSDLYSLSSIYKDLKNIFAYDKDTKQTILSIPEPEKVKNVGELIDECSIVIRIGGKNEISQPNYVLCTKLDGERYRKYSDGRIETGGISR